MNFTPIKNPILLAVLMALVLAACNPVSRITFAVHQPFDTGNSNDRLGIFFNGVGSFYLRFQGKAVLTDPFLSNPGPGKVIFGKIAPNTVLIDRLQPFTDDIQMIAIGHSHYDHMLDLPYFAKRVSDQTKIIGSSNTVKIAGHVSQGLEMVDVGQHLATPADKGQWIYSSDSSIRILPIRSAHLPHILGMHLYEGVLKDKHAQAFPQKSKHFLQDLTLAYLIDFMDGNHQPLKRIYFSSSAASPDNGFFPKEILQEKRVDVAILSLALGQKAKDYPQALVSLLQPDVVIPCHWENFFRNREKPLRWVSMTSFKKMNMALQSLPAGTRVMFVKPGHAVVL